MNFTKDFTQDFTIVGEFAIFKQKLETYNRFFWGGWGGVGYFAISQQKLETNN